MCYRSEHLDSAFLFAYLNVQCYVGTTVLLVCVCDVFVHIYVHTFVWGACIGQWTTLGVTLHLLPQDTVFLSFVIQASGIQLYQHLFCLRKSGITIVCYCTWLYKCPGDSNTGLHTDGQTPSAPHCNLCSLQEDLKLGVVSLPNFITLFLGFFYRYFEFLTFQCESQNELVSFCKNGSCGFDVDHIEQMKSQSMNLECHFLSSCVSFFCSCHLAPRSLIFFPKSFIAFD